jgi:membrane protease YdiL (CAAX protease family)
MLEFANSLLTTLALIFAPFALLALEGAKNFRKALSLDKARVTRTPLLAATMLAQLFFVMAAVSVALYALGWLDSWKVTEIIKAQDAVTLLLAVTLAPFAEELFFRGYLQKKTGVVLASVVFAALHFGYGSVSEISGALLASLVLGYGLRKHGDLWACIAAHAGYNAVTLALAFAV